jgi:CRP-like cAMP-binding protein
MNFYEALEEPHRTRLLALSAPRRLEPGERLFSQGDTSRDLYLVQDGSLDIVSQRGSTPVVVRTFTRGALVGEMSFLDAGYRRSMEVRSAEGASLVAWPFATLDTALLGDDLLSGAFYRFLAELLAARARSTSHDAVDGTLKAGAGADDRDAPLDAQAGLLAEALLGMRGTGADADSLHARIDASMVPFLAALDARLGRRDDADADRLAQPARDRLRPLLQRAATAELCYGAAHAGDPAWVAHVLAGVPEGAGPFGVALDRWLLQRPTLVGMRAARDAAVAAASVALRERPGARVEWVNPAGGGVLAGVMAGGAAVGAHVVLVGDVGDRDATEAVRARLVASGEAARAEALHVPLDRDAFLPSGRRGDRPDVLVLDGILEYLPERAAATLLRDAGTRLAEGGRIVLTTVGEAVDDALWRFVFGWPLIRRDGGSLRRLVAATGLRAASVEAYGGGWVVVTGG